MRRALWLLAVLLVFSPRSHAAARPHVYLIVVDGLGAGLATRERIPVLFADGAIRLDGRAVMPTRTNPNHTSLITAVYPGAHGVTGNGYWSRNPDDGPAPLEDAGLIDVETLFTVAEREQPALVTMGVFSKPKLRTLFMAAGSRQTGPDVGWTPEPGREGTNAQGYATDGAVMDAVLALTETREPDLVFVNMSEVDLTAHARGPEHPDVVTAAQHANAAIERLIAALHARGRWERSVVIVTADHGFDAVAPTSERPTPNVDPQRAFADVERGDGLAVADGGVAHVYASDVAATAPAFDASAATTLKRVAATASAMKGVAAVYARLPLDGVASLPAEWHLEHERAGDLLLIAADGHQFIGPQHGGDADRPGNHGGPGEISVPVVVLGGDEAVRRIDSARVSNAPDVGATVAALLGLRDARRVDGTPVPDAFRGRALLR